MNKLIKFSEEQLAYLEKIREENGLTSFQATCDLIIAQHRDRREQAQIITDALEEKYNKLWTRVRLGVSSTDKNVQTILEIVNSQLIQDPVEFIPTSIVKSGILAKGEEEVKERIARFKQVKDNAAVKKG